MNSSVFGKVRSLGPLVLGLGLGLVSAIAVAQTATPPPEHSHGGMAGGEHGSMMGGQQGSMMGGQQDAMMPQCKAMMADMKDMRAKVGAMDSSLDTLVTEMNAATGRKKVDAMAAVINELVSQRKTMREMMMEMQPKMMAHMMRHMQMGMMQGAAASLADCPMMKMTGAPHGEATQPNVQEHPMHHQR